MRARTKARLIGVALGVLLLVVTVYAHTVHEKKKQDNAKQAQPAAVPVTTAIAAQEPMSIVATGIGNVTPIYSVQVKVRVDGQLDKVTFAEGQNVKAGDLLVQIDPRPFQAQLAQFEAQKARDEAQLQNALLDLDRYTTLNRQDSIARQVYDTQVATVNQLKAAVKLDQAQMDNARVQLGYTTIRSPISGRTGVRLVDPGNIVHATDTSGIVTINQIDPISVLFTLPEEQLQNVLQGQAAKGKQPLVVEAYGRMDNALLGAGKLTLVNNQIDATTGTFQLRAVFPNPKSALWPGQYVNMRVTLRTVQDAIAIPSAAVQRGQQGQYVYTVKPHDTVAVQPVRLAQDEGGKAIVAQGVAAGDRIVVEGQYRLRPGVKVVEASAHSDAPPRVAERSGASSSPQ